MSKIPSFQFYPGDWLREASLRACSLAARGLWTDMLCWMHDSPVRGRLLKSTGAAFADTELSRMAGCSIGQLRKLLTELETSGALSRDENGVIYSRRMVSDEIARAKAAENGRLGGNPNLKRGSDVGSPSQEGDANQEHKGGLKGGDKAVVSSGGSLKQTPSSSSSSSSSTSSSNTLSASADGGSKSDEGKKANDTKPKRKGTPNPLFDAVAEITASDPTTAAGYIAKVAAALNAATPPYTPEDVREFGRRAKEICTWLRDPPRPPTLSDVEKHIGKLRLKPPPTASAPKKYFGDNPETDF